MRTALALILVFAISGCRAVPSEPELSALRDAPTSITLAGEPFALSVDLWRDFMPSSPPDGRPLAAVVRLPDHLATVRVERIWVIFGIEVWGDDADQVPGTQDWVARDGPKWGPGVHVDVVARLREADGRQVLVRAANRTIQRTD
jgi:hypothetical protein